MRIAVISDWFAEQMGYAENCLPKALAALGHEVVLLTSNVKPYFDLPSYPTVYEPFIGPAQVDCGIKSLDGYELRRLPHGRWRGRLRIKGLVAALKQIRPAIVQTFDLQSVSTYESALARPILRYRLFHESHVHRSVYPLSTSWADARPRRKLQWLLTTALPGRAVSLLSEHCYPVSSDAADIATGFFGMEAGKVTVCSLGVDTALFRPASGETSRSARMELRARLGFGESDTVCIYTGRLSADKDPLCLATAIDRLNAAGLAYRALFLGDGPQAEAIRACRGCVVHPFVVFQELPRFYQAADIGVWPRQESTSQLDAAACGLPLILSDRIEVRERVDGNGLLYHEGDVDDLAMTIQRLDRSGERARMGAEGSRRIRECFSWERIAKARVADYEAALR